MDPLDQIDLNKLPRHIAIIMDGNGRWARRRLMNRIHGHREGAKSVRAVVTTCRKLNIPYLTLYAFSKENWRRPAQEINALWDLLLEYIDSQLPEMLEKGIRLNTIGDEEGLPERVIKALDFAKEKTSKNKDMVVNLAINYGGRQEIIAGIKKLVQEVMNNQVNPDDINMELFSGYLFTGRQPDPDLLIRTSGEFRISNFLLWQLAYTEIYVTPVLWPDFREKELIEAIKDYQRRERRFGRTSDQLHTHQAEIPAS
ncbi:MAG: isoprenyl transferase [Deltaproteobacteria bacterium]|nr:MAG: isoprenyl transferase [Deltaproteobacteria bacterium]RLB07849.1 MAG: isoprenyl transferase [Deltaproteobacteria bacterium]HEC31434.1 isoprenyl transferase [Deltaproteobacteria bacterium]